MNNNMVKEPTSMEELVYHTIRVMGDGQVRVWVYKQDCPKCGKAKMAKPRDEKTGKVKVRAKEYLCPSCGNEVEKKAYEETLEAEFKGTCPTCKKEVEGTVPFKRDGGVRICTGRLYPNQACGATVKPPPNRCDNFRLSQPDGVDNS